MTLPCSSPRSFLPLALSLLVVAGSLPARGAPDQQERVSRARFAPDEEIPETLRREALAMTWETIRDKYFDPEFGGVDWEGVIDIYEPRALEATTSGAFHAVLREMLDELSASHVILQPPPTSGAGAPPTPRQRVDGVELRRSGDRIIVYSVAEGTPAFEAGMRAGQILQAVAGADLDEMRPTEGGPRDQRRDHLYAARAALWGEPGSEAQLVVIEDHDEIVPIPVPRTGTRGRHVPGLAKSEVTHRLLTEKIAYVAFEAWAFDLEKVLNPILRRYEETDGLVIDLRHNFGGVGDGADYLVGRLVEEDTSLGTDYPRDGEPRSYPVSGSGDQAYRGAVVILIDECSASASEVFTACLQEQGRATVIGCRSLGAVLNSTQCVLPTGAVLQYPHSDYLTAGGTRLEDRGVIPDAEVILESLDLFEGKDTLIEAAIHCLEESAED